MVNSLSSKHEASSLPQLHRVAKRDTEDLFFSKIESSQRRNHDDEVHTPGRNQKQLFSPKKLNLELTPLITTPRNSRPVSPTPFEDTPSLPFRTPRSAVRTPRSTQQRLHTFKAVKVYKSEYISRQFYENILVHVNSEKRVLELFCTDPNQKPQNCGRLVIPWDDITGLDFQYAPCQPVLVTIELSKKPEQAPKGFSSVVYFLQCSKVDCEKYLDNILLKNDKRLLKLSIQSLPTWSVVVNRYYIPVFYSYNIRRIVTFIVNFYVIISLIWGFYDLYKNLPVVGNAMKTLFGPITRIIEPLRSNKLILLLPLVFENAFRLVFGIFQTFTQTFRTMISGVTRLLQVDGVLNVLTVLIGFLEFIYLHVIFVVSSMWNVFKLPLELISLLAKTVISLFSNLKYLFSMPVNTIVSVVTSLFSFVSFVFKVLVFPISKCLSLGRNASQVVQTVSDTARTTSELKDYLQTVKENVAPVSQTYSGFRRVVDWFIHTYHSTIKHRSPTKQRLLIWGLLLLTATALIILAAVVL